MLNIKTFSVKCSISYYNRIFHYVRLNITLFHLKDHQTGVGHHRSQAIQGPKLAVHASGAESWTACLTTQTDVSMAWVLWDASLGKLSRTGCSGSKTVVVHLEWLMAQCVRTGSIVSCCWRCFTKGVWWCCFIVLLFSWTVSSVWGMPNTHSVSGANSTFIVRFSVVPLT